MKRDLWVNLAANWISIPVEMFDEFTPIFRDPYFRESIDGTNKHTTEVITDYAVDFIQNRAQDQPFCLSISFNAAHAEDNDRIPGSGHYPWPKTVDGLYEDVEISTPRIDTTQYKSLPEFFTNSLNRERYFWRWDTPEKYDTNMRAYYRMISGIDQAVGRILKTLQDEGITEETLIIYTADNGYYGGNRGFAGKWTHFEESMRIPMIVYDPRIEESASVDHSLVLNIDIPATILNAGGIDIPESYQGQSLLPLTRGETNPRKVFLWEHLWEIDFIPKWEGVRTDQYSFARYTSQDPPYVFLHDLEKDPDQLENHAEHPEYHQVLAELENGLRLLNCSV